MTTPDEPSSPAPPRSRRLGWLAPLSSGALLIYLISRVSSCGHVAPLEPAQHAPPAAPPAREAPNEDTDASVPGFTMTPEMLRGRSSLEFLGATKAAPMVLGDSLHEPSASEPAVEPENAPAPRQALPQQASP